MPGNFPPAGSGDLTDAVQAHTRVFNKTKEGAPPESADRDEIVARLRVIETPETDGAALRKRIGVRHLFLLSRIAWA